ncbi:MULTISPECIES: hypothetical protein [Microbacterium]|uniref:hypothetical protein n=1 Tax=Microbacterium TaxID=33882 RepID=UPI0027890655|nr:MULTISPECIES: hypothetical protein [Microbacterium]MDQ1082363.1 hypothetical protein [Microbacterium sp. SORGH_AS_0344]MDQ1168866.1 hypothetical protein [Microbacterium proteolyticum]
MPDLGWVGPAAIIVAAAALLVLTVIVVVRAQRRSRRVRAAASQAVSEAAAALLALDDAVDGLDLDFEAADALESADVPSDLRRSRATAHRVRDRGYSDVITLDADTGVAARRRDQARRVRQALAVQHERVAETRTRLTEWAGSHRTPDRLLAAARRRRDEVAATSGDPGPLLAALRARFDELDWADAASAAEGASAALADADAALARATNDSAPGHLRDAIAALHRADRHLRAVEEDHRVALQAADNAVAEAQAARSELDEAIEVATSRPEACREDAAERLRAATAELDDAAGSAARRPRETIATVARLREERDHLLGDAVSVRRRVEAARAALPGTLACARAALASAERRDAGSEDAAHDDDNRIAHRLRLERARRHLSAARAATDATQALADARTAWAAVR